MKRLLLFIICSVIAIGSYAQGDTLTLVRVNKQRHFKHQVPAGNYSGITRIGKDEYAVVSDKSPKDGYYVFRITIDSVKGYVYDVQTICFRGVNDINRDAEGIVYLPQTNTLLISGEADNQILEYQLDGNRTIRKVELPSILRTASRNEGLNHWLTTSKRMRYGLVRNLPYPKMAHKQHIVTASRTTFDCFPLMKTYNLSRNISIRWMRQRYIKRLISLLMA